MATTHTFGPWIAEDLQIVGKFNRQSIATIVLAGNSRQMMRANARLIAAAPDLLLTLQIAKCVVELNQRRLTMEETLESCQRARDHFAARVGELRAALELCADQLEHIPHNPRDCERAASIARHILSLA